MNRLAVLLILAASHAGAHANRLEKLDANQDGALALTEALNARRAIFAKLDGNHDGSIQPLELAQQSRRAKRLVMRFARIDQNSDQQISQSEWDKPIAELFARLDANNDRQISAAEMQQARNYRRR